jgi:formylglycine-generating enzyme required for sulfatase activity
VRAGTYRIGGWAQDEPAADIALAAFWIARVPITVAQYTPFVAVGYGAAARRWWTPHGWTWKTTHNRMQPRWWDDKRFHRLDQPVIGIGWYEATAFCVWLTEQLGAALPAGYMVRLPSEAEWEAAAAYDMAMRRHPYPWGEDAPTPEQAVYGRAWWDGPRPVGHCPAGAAACGALDMAGTVWEVMASSYWGYPARSGEVIKDFTAGEADVPWRGGGYWNNSIFVRWGARDWLGPVVDAGDFGFRVVVAPRSYYSQVQSDE